MNTGNVPVDDPEVLRDILANTEALLLDFDGPICSVFAGVGAHNVADQLRTVLADGGHTDLPTDIATSEDPFDVFRYAATLGDDEARHVEAAFTAHEVEAIPTATTTPGAHELITTWHDTGRPLAIVSNNSAAAVNAYLDLYNIQPMVCYLAARDSSDPSRLKPSDWLLENAISTLSVDRSRCVLFGDSATDVVAARSSAVRVIGFVNKDDKREQLVMAMPDAICKDLKEIVRLSLNIRK